MISPAVAQQLRDRGHDVSAIAERPDLVGTPDDQVLAVAATENRVVVTVNTADFADLDNAWKNTGRPHAGIVFVAVAAFPQNRGFIGALVRALDATARSELLPEADETAFLRRA